MKYMWLLDRLRELEQHPEKRFEDEKLDVRIADIQLHLHKLLNTRQGSVQLDPEYGIPDLTDLPSTLSGETIQQLQDDLEKIIIRYEKRLKNVQVGFDWVQGAQPLLAFQITGELDDPDHPMPTVFEALVEEGGRISLNG